MTNLPATAPSEQELSQASAVLRRLQPGFLPLEVFLEFTRLCATPILELVPLRRNQGTTEVMLLRRPADDPNWPNQLHTPGTVVRATDVDDASLASPFARLYNDELEVQPVTEPVYIETILHRSNRGAEFATVYYIDLTDEVVPTAKWYSANLLPEDLVETQRGFIATAVKIFEKEQTK